MELKSYLRILARRWWICLIVALVITGATIYGSGLIPPKYQAEASLRVTTPLGGSMGDVSYQTYYADRLMNTYVQVANSDTLLNQVKTKLALEKLPDVTVKIIPNSEIIQITVTGSDAALVAKVANTVAEEVTSQSQGNPGSDTQQNLKILADHQSSLQKELDQAKQDYTTLVASYAKTDAQMAMLDRSITADQAYYQNLQQQYQENAISAATSYYPTQKAQAKQAMDLLSTEMARVEKGLTDFKQQYQDLSVSSTQYSQQLTTLRQTIQNDESTLSNLMSQDVSIRIANTKYQDAQSIVIGNPAQVPTKPTGLSRAILIGLGVLLGIILGIFFAFVVDNFDTRIYSIDQIHSLSTLPILGQIPKLGKDACKTPFTCGDISIRRAYWSLCTRFLSLKDAAGKTILLTSPNPSEGKSATLVGLAQGLAKAKKRVLVIDADLRKSGLDKLFDVTGEVGLRDFLSGEKTLDEVIQHLADKGVDFIASGPIQDDPMDLFQSPRFQMILDKSASYDFVLIDSPALLSVPDAYYMSTLVDGVILLAQRKHTTVDDIKVALDQLESGSVKMLGIITTRFQVRHDAGYYQRRPAYQTNRGKTPIEIQPNA